MKKYRDVPMVFADACLMRLAEELRTNRVLTLDSDLRFCRRGRNRPFDFIDLRTGCLSIDSSAHLHSSRWLVKLPALKARVESARDIVVRVAPLFSREGLQATPDRGDRWR